MDKFIYIQCILTFISGSLFKPPYNKWKIQITYNQITDKEEPQIKIELAHKTWFDKSKQSSMKFQEQKWEEFLKTSLRQFAKNNHFDLELGA
jgi:hypothetical protein